MAGPGVFRDITNVTNTEVPKASSVLSDRNQATALKARAGYGKENQENQGENSERVQKQKPPRQPRPVAPGLVPLLPQGQDGPASSFPEPLPSLTPEQLKIHPEIQAAAEELRGCWAAAAGDAEAVQNRGSTATGRGAHLHTAAEKFGQQGPPELRHNLLQAPKLPMPAQPAPTSVASQVPAILQQWHTRGLEGEEPGHSANSDLIDLAKDGALLRVSHEKAERIRYASQGALELLPAEDRLPADEREKLILWLAQVLVVNNISDMVLHSTVVLLDLYCAKKKVKDSNQNLHLLVTATLGLAIKVAGAESGLSQRPGHLKNLLLFLGHNKFTNEDIVTKELEILEVLGYSIIMTTPLHFLNMLCLPYARRGDQLPHPVVCLSTFFLELALGDTTLLSKFPYVILAAGAVHLAQWCIKDPNPNPGALLADVAVAMTK